MANILIPAVKEYPGVPASLAVAKGDTLGAVDFPFSKTEVVLGEMPTTLHAKGTTPFLGDRLLATPQSALKSLKNPCVGSLEFLKILKNFDFAYMGTILATNALSSSNLAGIYMGYDCSFTIARFRLGFAFEPLYQ